MMINPMDDCKVPRRESLAETFKNAAAWIIKQVSLEIHPAEHDMEFSQTDINARLFFPLTFVIINFIYWVVVLYYLNDEFAKIDH